MARKDTLFNFISLGQSLAANFISPVTMITYLDNISYQINITTSDSEGSFVVEVSDDYDIAAVGDGRIQNPGHWTALDLGGTPVVAGADDTIMISMHQMPFKAVRLNYTSSVAGTGTCDIYVGNKQVGG